MDALNVDLTKAVDVVVDVVAVDVMTVTAGVLVEGEQEHLIGTRSIDLLTC